MLWIFSRWFPILFAALFQFVCVRVCAVGFWVAADTMPIKWNHKFFFYFNKSRQGEMQINKFYGIWISHSECRFRSLSKTNLGQKFGWNVLIAFCRWKHIFVPSIGDWALSLSFSFKCSFVFCHLFRRSDGARLWGGSGTGEYLSNAYCALLYAEMGQFIFKSKQFLFGMH